MGLVGLASLARGSLDAPVEVKARLRSAIGPREPVRQLLHRTGERLDFGRFAWIWALVGDFHGPGTVVRAPLRSAHRPLWWLAAVRLTRPVVRGFAPLVLISDTVCFLTNKDVKNTKFLKTRNTFKIAFSV